MATPTLGSVPTTLEDCEATTGWTFTSVALDGDLKKQGSNSVFGILRNDLHVASWNIVTDGGSAQNMTGRHVRCYIWFNSVGLLDTEANNGMEFFMYDGTNTAYWVAFGSDTYEGGWKNFVLDCDSSPDSGSFDKTIVQAWGWRYNRTAAPRNVDNTWIDYLRYGDGYYATGGTSGDEITLATIAAVDKTNGYGILEVIEGVYFCYGALTIGNGATTTWFKMSNEVLVYADAPVASTLYCLDGVGSGCRVNIDGSVIRASGSARFAVDLSDSGVVSATLTDTLIAPGGGACAFKSGQTITGNTFSGPGQITHGGANMNNSTIFGYEGTVGSGVLLYNVNADPDGEMDNMTFVKGTAATAAIELGSNTPSSITLNGHSYTGYNASGGQNDSTIYNNSGKAVTINYTGDTPTVRNGTGASTTLVSSVPLKVTITNHVGNLQEGVRVRYEESDGTLISQGSTNSSGVFTFSEDVSNLPYANASIIARKKPFESFRQGLTIPVTGFDIPVTMQPDTSVNLP
jgi:hypothetical protein